MENPNAKRTLVVPLSSMLAGLFSGGAPAATPASTAPEPDKGHKRGRHESASGGGSSWRGRKRGRQQHDDHDATDDGMDDDDVVVAENDQKASGHSAEQRSDAPAAVIDPCAVFINGIPFAVVDASALSEALAGFGSIKEARVAAKDGKGLGYGFVLFENQADAVKCLSATDLKVGDRAVSCKQCNADLVVRWLAPPPPPPKQIVTTATITSFKPRTIKPARAASSSAASNNASHLLSSASSTSGGAAAGDDMQS